MAASLVRITVDCIETRCDLGLLWGRFRAQRPRGHGGSPPHVLFPAVVVLAQTGVRRAHFGWCSASQAKSWRIAWGGGAGRNVGASPEKARREAESSGISAGRRARDSSPTRFLRGGGGYIALQFPGLRHRVDRDPPVAGLLGLLTGPGPRQQYPTTGNIFLFSIALSSRVGGLA